MLSPSQIQTLEELDKWQGVIDTPEKWCKYSEAELESGGEVSVYHSRAVRFCLSSAAVIAGTHAETLSALREELHPMGHTHFGDFNDDPSTTHADVMALFERAKEKVRNG